MEREVNKRAIREEWEAGGISFKALAEKHGVPEGTLKSWAKREGWQKCNRNPDATGAKKVATADATDKEKVATETESKKYNWEKLKTDFLTGEYKNLKEFAEKNSVPYNGYFFNQTSGWLDEKKRIEREKQEKIREQTIEKTAEKASEEFSDFAVHTVKTLLEIYEENQAIERNLIAKLYQKTDQVIEELNLKQVVTKRKKKAKLVTQIPADLNVGGTQITSEGDLEYTVEDTEENIDTVVGIIDHDKYEAATRGLERIQKMNRIAFGVERMEKREDMLLQKQANKPAQIAEGAANEGEMIVRFVDGDE